MTMATSQNNSVHPIVMVFTNIHALWILVDITFRTNRHQAKVTKHSSSSVGVLLWCVLLIFLIRLVLKRSTLYHERDIIVGHRAWYQGDNNITVAGALNTWNDHTFTQNMHHTYTLDDKLMLRLTVEFQKITAMELLCMLL